MWDTGPGIPAEQQDLVFEEFYQLGNPERNRSKGLGLGLAIVRRTANLLGHRITVRSKVGQGTMFRVALPLADAPTPSADPAAHPDTPALASRTVLVIEDEEQQRGALSMYLQAQGCRTIVAASAEEAVAQLGEEGGGLPDVVVSDFRLTGRTTGLDAVAAVRQKAGRPIPAVLVTGDTDPARLRQAKRAGCALLHKPYRPDDLRRALSQAFERKPG